MTNQTPVWFQNLQNSELEPIVCQILNQPIVEILERHIQPLSGGAAEHTGRGFGIYRVTGTARHDNHEASWSVVAKVFGASANAEANEPAHVDYWKREMLAYQSGILLQLPGNVVAPRCYAILELPDAKYCMWLEAVHEADSTWTIEQHQQVARHLGQFNGAYLNGHPLPEQTLWMGRGRMQVWLGMFPPDKEQLLLFSETNLGRWLSRQSIERMMNLWQQRQSLLAAFDRLPNCFCHHDAFRRNLMLRQTENGSAETVAIDWAYTGLGKVCQEIGVTTAVNLFFMEVPATLAQELNQAVFTGYSAGLRDAGWQDNLQLARFGYTVTAALTFGLASGVIYANFLQSPNGVAIAETILGHPIDNILEQWTIILPFLLDLGDEALALMPSL